MAWLDKHAEIDSMQLDKSQLSNSIFFFDLQYASETNLRRQIIHILMSSTYVVVPQLQILLQAKLGYLSPNVQRWSSLFEFLAPLILALNAYIYIVLNFNIKK